MSGPAPQLWIYRFSPSRRGNRTVASHLQAKNPKRRRCRRSAASSISANSQRSRVGLSRLRRSAAPLEFGRYASDTEGVIDGRGVRAPNRSDVRAEPRTPGKRCIKESHPERVPEVLLPSTHVTVHCTRAEAISWDAIWHPLRGAFLGWNAVRGCDSCEHVGSVAGRPLILIVEVLGERRMRVITRWPL